MSANNPLHIARAAQDMARHADGMDSRLFGKVALVSMCVMATASAAGVLIELLKQFKAKDRERDRQDRGR
jgi:hypothetical protein